MVHVGTRTCLRPGWRMAMVSVSEPPDRPPLSPVQEGCPPERDAVLTEAAADEAEVPLPSSPQTFFLGGIFALGVFAALYVASSIILPVVRRPLLFHRRQIRPSDSTSSFGPCCARMGCPDERAEP